MGARVWEADPHLTDEWIQAADDLREIWSWDWRAMRKDSSFEYAFPKFVYTTGYPLADVTHGFYGEERFRWSWTEDLDNGNLCISNHCWSSDAAKLYVSQDDATYAGVGGEQLSFGPQCSWTDLPQNM